MNTFPQSNVQIIFRGVLEEIQILEIGAGCVKRTELKEADDIFCYPLQLLQEKNVSEFVALEQPCVANLVAAA